MSESALDLRYNISALTIAILRKDVKTPEQAFAIIAGKERPAADIEELYELKNAGMTYREIGEIFGVDKTAVFHRLKRYKTKLQESCS